MMLLFFIIKTSIGLKLFLRQFPVFFHLKRAVTFFIKLAVGLCFMSIASSKRAFVSLAKKSPLETPSFEDSAIIIPLNFPEKCFHLLGFSISA
jgi:hypothetical protein